MAELALALASNPRLRRGVVSALSGRSVLFERLLNLAHAK
jgi:hypothetical protein